MRHSASHLSLQASIVYKALPKKHTYSWAQQELLFTEAGAEGKKPYKLAKSAELYKIPLNRILAIKKNLNVSIYFPNIHLIIYIDTANKTSERDSEYQVLL